jgi:PPOX class probable F420-dependent enzyme
MYTDEQRQYLEDHRLAVLATSKGDGSPQVSMVIYALDGDDILLSVKSYTAKWKNALRQPEVALLVHEDRRQLIVYGTATGIDEDPERAETSAKVWGAMLGEAPNPDDIVESLDEQQRTVLRITPNKVFMND